MTDRPEGGSAGVTPPGPATAPLPKRRPEPPKPKRSLPLGSLVLGLLLVLIGVGWLLETTGAVEVPWGALIPGGLIVVGLALLIGSSRGQKTGGLVGIGVVLAVMAGLFALVDVPLGSGVGERSVRPTRVQELERSYELAVGELTVDLGRLDLASGTTRVEAHVAMGQLRVFVPEGVPLLIEGEAAVGSVRLLDRSADGLGAGTVFRDGDYRGAPRRLHLELSVGVGDVEVRR
jgi:hypothetical protein